LRSQARAKVSRGQWDEGLKTYIQAVGAFRDGQEHNELASTLAEVADGLAERGKRSHAAAFYDQAIAAAAKTSDPQYLAPILRDAGLFFRKEGQDARAREMLRDGFDLFELLKDEWAQAQLAHELGRLATEAKSIDDALEWYRRALALCPEERDADLRMRCFFDMGVAFRAKGLTERAHSCFNNSAHIAKKIFDADCLIVSLEELGRIAFDAGEVAQAKRLLKEAYAMNEGLLTSRRPGAARDEADAVYERRKDVLVDLMISTYLGDPNVAVSEREVAEFIAHLHRRRDLKGLSSALAKIGDYFRVRGEHARAARFFESAAGVFERAGMPLVSAQVAELLGDLYRDRGLPRKAFNRYWRGAALLEEAKGPDEEALRRTLRDRMDALKPALASATREGDDAVLADSPAKA
jgi:tetratricopeptide (TPR) repeat protein